MIKSIGSKIIPSFLAVCMTFCGAPARADDDCSSSPGGAAIGGAAGYGASVFFGLSNPFTAGATLYGMYKGYNYKKDECDRRPPARSPAPVPSPTPSPENDEEAPVARKRQRSCFYNEMEVSCKKFDLLQSPDPDVLQATIEDLEREVREWNQSQQGTKKTCYYNGSRVPCSSLGHE